MDGPGIEAYVAVTAGILLGALLAAVEAGLSAIGDVRLRAIRDEHGPSHGVAARLLEDWSTVRARLLAGRVLSLAAAAAFAAGVGLRLGGLGGAVGAALVAAFLYAMAAEMSTAIARQRASRVILRLLPWLRPLELVLAPLAWPLVAIGRLAASTVPRTQDPDSPRITELAVEHVIERGEETGSIAQDHAELLRSVLEFRNTVAREVMVPRTQAVAFDVNTPVDEVLDRVVESGHSRYPIYRDRIDQMEGVLYAKDLFRVVRDGERMHRVRLEELIRKPVFFAEEAQKIGTLLRGMQARRVHLAVVVDEFGGTSGIVTLEDILEEIVGEIQDEHDDDERRVEKLEAGHYMVVDAGISIHDLEDVLGEKLPQPEGAYDSLAGMVVEVAGRVPDVGESVQVGRYELIVRDADERHVTRVELIRGSEGDVDDEDIQAAE